MNDHPARFTAPARKLEAKSFLLESVFVAVIGAVFAFVANEISPRGLSLTRNYFPGSTRSSLPTVATAHPATGTGDTRVAVLSPPARLAARLQAQGLQLIDSNQVVQLFRDPRYEQELVVFIDASDDRHYQEGHIPGAYQFDHYHPENYVATVLPACQSAERIVVYCTGGECEDSEFTALTLRDVGIPKERLFVYGGGMTEWATNGLPVEIGGRNSRNVRHARP